MSTKELLLLAQLGRLRADDLIWRSGSNTQTSIRSLLGSAASSPRAIIKPQKLQANGAAAPPPSAPEPVSVEASLPVPEAVLAAESAKHRNWARIGALTGVLLVSLVVVVAGLGAAAFLQSDPGEEKAAVTETKAPAPEPVAVNAPAPAQPAVATDKPTVTTDQVAVRKVKVLDIAAPPPNQPPMFGPAATP